MIEVPLPPVPPAHQVVVLGGTPPPPAPAQEGAAGPAPQPGGLPPATGPVVAALALAGLAFTGMQDAPPPPRRPPPRAPTPTPQATQAAVVPAPPEPPAAPTAAATEAPVEAPPAPPEPLPGGLDPKDKQAVAKALFSGELDQVEAALELDRRGLFELPDRALTRALNTKVSARVSPVVARYLGERPGTEAIHWAMLYHYRNDGPAGPQLRNLLLNRGHHIAREMAPLQRTVDWALADDPEHRECLRSIQRLKYMRGKAASAALAKLRESNHPSVKAAAEKAWAERYQQAFVTRP